MLDALEEIAQLIDIKHRLRNRVFSACFNLPFESPQLFIEIYRAGVDADPDRERGRLPVGLLPRSKPWFSLFTIFVRPIASISKLR